MSGYQRDPVSPFSENIMYRNDYNEKVRKREKVRALRLPIFLFLVGVIILGYFLYTSVKEIYYIQKGTPVECSMASAGDVLLYAPDGKQYKIDASMAQTTKKSIVVYYVGDNYKGAITLVKPWFMVVGYVTSGALTAATLIWIIKIIKAKDVFTLGEYG